MLVTTKCSHRSKPSSAPCALCEPDAEYSLIPVTSKKDHLVEILRDGKPWSAAGDSNFCFGRVKAKMVIASQDIVKRFALADNPGSLLVEPKIIYPDPDLTIRLQSFPNFTVKGNLVYEPYLRLDGTKRGKPYSFGFGRAKAAALILLMDDLEKWLEGVGGWW